MNKKIVLVGCGKMGGAILEGFVKNTINPENIKVVEPSLYRKKEYKKKYNIQVVPTANEIAKNFTPDIIIFAVKPQIIDEILPEYKPFSNRKTLFISVIAGKEIKQFENILGKHAKIIRTMPNLPATIGKGITVACANNNISTADINQTKVLLATLGEVTLIKEEALLHQVTALSGSGPAYVFYFIECLIEAGKKIGLSEELAKTLTYKTIQGSIELIIDQGVSASELRKQVTSPKGTTEAGLALLMKEHGSVKQIVKKTLKAATKRSTELSK